MIYSPFSLLLEFSAVKLNSCTQLNNIILLILSFTDAGSVKPSYCDSSLEDKKGAKKRRLLVGKSQETTMMNVETLKWECHLKHCPGALCVTIPAVSTSCKKITGFLDN